MSEQLVRVRTQGGVTELRLNQSAHGNSLGPALVGQLHSEVLLACAAPAVHTLVLRGEGRHFCTGFDLSTLDTETDASLLERFVRIELLLDLLWNAPLRTVAVATGKTWGAGADLFAACDQRIAAGDATFRFPGAGFGIVLGTRRLMERVGRDMCRSLVQTNFMINGVGAVSCGLATELLEGDASSWAFSAGAPSVGRATMGELRRVTGQDQSDADLAALVRSAAARGLKERMKAYRAAALAQAHKAAG